MFDVPRSIPRLALIIVFGLIVMSALSNLGAVARLIAVIGFVVIGLVIALGCNRDVLDLIRSLVKPSAAPTPVPFVDGSTPITPMTMIDQPPSLPAPRVPVRPRSRRKRAGQLDKWGF